MADMKSNFKTVLQEVVDRVATQLDGGARALPPRNRLL